MTDISFDKDRDGERDAGVYLSTFISIEDFDYTDKISGEKEYRWRWNFVDENDAPLDTITSRHFRQNSNGLRFLTGLLGRPPKEGDKPSDLYGKLVNVVWGVNRGGKLTITDILPYKAPKGDTVLNSAKTDH